MNRDHFRKFVLFASVTLIAGACGSSHKQGAPTAASTTALLPTTTTTAASTAGTTNTTASVGGCSNVAATAEVKAQLVAVRGIPHLIIPDGDLFLGKCDNTQYASAIFRPDSTHDDQAETATQDEGYGWQYFKTDAHGNWTQTGTAPFPNQTNSCLPRNPAPQALVDLWHNCAGAPVS